MSLSSSVKSIVIVHKPLPSAAVGAGAGAGTGVDLEEQEDPGGHCLWDVRVREGC